MILSVYPIFSYILSIVTAVAEAAFYITGTIAFILFIRRRR